MRTTDAQKHSERLALYKQGLKDKEIAAKTGVARVTIAYWRRVNRLPANWVKRETVPRPVPRSEKQSVKQTVPMEEALTPDQCQAMRQFFADLLTVADVGKVEVGRFMAIYRDGSMIERGA